MRKLLILALALLILNGCAAKTIPLSAESATQLNGSTLAHTKREAAGFMATTAGKAAFGVLGAVAMMNAGKKIIEENNIEDPANYISSSLANDLAKTFNLQVASEKDTAVSSTNVSDLAAEYPQADFILDVRTGSWSFIYFPTDWSHYRVLYSSRLQLIDVKSKRVVADSICSRVPEKTESSPTYEELLAGNAQRLKNELKVAADYCIDQFRSQVFNLTSTSEKTALK